MTPTDKVNSLVEDLEGGLWHATDIMEDPTINCSQELPDDNSWEYSDDEWVGDNER